MNLKNQLKYAKAQKLSAKEQNYVFWMIFFMLQSLIKGNLSGLSMRKLTRFILVHKMVGESLKDSTITAASDLMRKTMNAITIDGHNHEWRTPNDAEQAAMWEWFASFNTMMKHIGAHHYSTHWAELEAFEGDAIAKGKADSQEVIIEKDTESGLYHNPSTDHLRDIALNVLQSLKNNALTLLRLRQEMEINAATAKRIGLILAPLVKRGIVEKFEVVEHGKKTTAYSYV